MKAQTPSCTFLFYFMILFTLPSYLSAQELPVEIQDWKGTWYTVQKQDTLFEKWEMSDHGAMKGESWVIKANKDSVHSEFLRLFSKEATIVYESVVQAQHGEKPTPFQMILQTSNYWIFFNEENDFPKFIFYKRIAADQLKAVISNSDTPEKGNSVEFNFRLYQR